MVTITAGPKWAIGLQAEYVSFDNALIVYCRDGKQELCDASMFRWR
jgi:hypothetical protein